MPHPGVRGTSAQGQATPRPHPQHHPPRREQRQDRGSEQQDKAPHQDRLRVPQHRHDDRPRHAVLLQHTDPVAQRQCSDVHKQRANSSRARMKRPTPMPEEPKKRRRKAGSATNINNALCRKNMKRIKALDDLHEPNITTCLRYMCIWESQ